jgi:hypothetical protein
MLTRGAIDLLQPQQQQQYQNNDQQHYSSFALGGVRRAAAAGQLGQSNFPLNSARATTITIVGEGGSTNTVTTTTVNPFGGRAVIDNYRQHEAYKEQRLKMALELRMSVANRMQSGNGNGMNSQMNNNNNSNANGSLSSRTTMMRSASATNATKERFDEVFRPMPTAQWNKELSAVQNNNNNGGNSVMNSIFAFLATDAAANTGLEVINTKSENFDPLQLLGMK